MQRIDWKYRIAFVLFWFVVLLMLSNLTSCTTAKKFMQSPDFAQACADSFPARDTIIETVTHYETDTTYLPGDSIIILDTVYSDSNDGIDVDTTVVDCPPRRVITKTVIKEKQIIRIDSARMRDVQNKLVFTERELVKWIDKAKRRGKSFMWSLIANALLLAGIGFIIAKKLKPM